MYDYIIATDESGAMGAEAEHESDESDEEGRSSVHNVRAAVLTHFRYLDAT